MSTPSNRYPKRRIYCILRQLWRSAKRRSSLPTWQCRKLDGVEDWWVVGPCGGGRGGVRGYHLTPTALTPVSPVVQQSRSRAAWLPVTQRHRPSAWPLHQRTTLSAESAAAIWTQMIPKKGQGGEAITMLLYTDKTINQPQQIDSNRLSEEHSTFT